VSIFGRHRKGHEIVAALTVLANAGKAKRSVGAITGGRPPTVWIEQGKGEAPSGGRFRSLMSQLDRRSPR
jgi:hypothetical protein